MTPTVLARGFSFLEGPRWHDGRLWASDIYGREIVAVAPDGVVERIHDVPGRPSGLGWLPDGSLVVVSQEDSTVLRIEPSGIRSVHAELGGISTGMLNDLVVDGAGNTWVGNLGFDFVGGAPVAPTRLVRIRPDGDAEAVGDDVWFPNGMAITPDGGTLLVGESFGNRISAFPLSPTGEVGPRRTWAAFGGMPDTSDASEFVGRLSAMPDGMCLDAEGALWMADAIGSRVIRVTEGGTVLAEVSTAEAGAFACMLGGADGRTLFICSSLPLDRHEEATTTRNGTLLTMTAPAPRAGRP